MLYDMYKFVKPIKWGFTTRIKLCVYTSYNTFFFVLKLCVAKAGDLGLASEREAWCVDLLTLSDKYLSKVILQEDSKFKTVSSWKKVFNTYTFSDNGKVSHIAHTCVCYVPS